MKFQICHVFILVMNMLSVSAATAQELCPKKPELTDDCVTVDNWNSLKSILWGTETVVLCPFDITKSDREPIEINRASKIICRKSDEDDCIIRGQGIHFLITSQEPTFFQGLTFEGSDEHGVYIESGIPTNVHTFCECAFLRIKREDSVRGGALKTERDTGIVNIVSCIFRENYSNFAGAIYTRSNSMNIIGSYFLDNTSTIGMAGAIVAANYADISITSSSFSGNYGKHDHAIVVYPVPGPATFIDGGGNTISEFNSCMGFYDWSAKNCTKFAEPVPLSSAVTLQPTISSVPSTFPSSAPPTASPSAQPTQSIAPSQSPTVSAVPSAFPSISPSSFPSVSLVPSAEPSMSMAPSTAVDRLCVDFEPYGEDPCETIESWNGFIAAIASADDHVVFCPFEIDIDSNSSAIIERDLVLLCKRSDPEEYCIINGPDTHLTIRGDASVAMSGFQFNGATQSAVNIETTSRWAVSAFCQCVFMNNNRNEGGDGGALTTGEDAGEVNVVDCVFADNSASRGGAIFAQSFRLTVLNTSFNRNTAQKTGGVIYVGSSTHLLVRGCLFYKNSAEEENYSIVVRPEETEPGIQSVWVDAGTNMVVSGGLCGGFYIAAYAECETFDFDAHEPVVYPYLPGELSVYDDKTGLLLASGLRVRELARSGEPVRFRSGQATSTYSSIPFHLDPDGAGVVPTGDGGWIYVSNCESTLGREQGGVYAVVFDSAGAIKDYHTLLEGTTRNCNGGLTPWNSWISCEETGGGQCWQVDPFGLRPPEPTNIVEPEGGNFEAFTYDVRDPNSPCFFVTEDHDRGALRRWCPDAMHHNETWGMLHGQGTRDYLKIVNETHFEWTPLLEEGRQSAQRYFPFSEGISHKNGILYFVCKQIKILFIANLDTGEYRTESTNDVGILVGDGSFTNEPDHLLQGPRSDMLYFTEDGGIPGVYGRKASTGQYFAVMEAEGYKHDEMTGLAWSPDWQRMYVCIQEAGLLLEITRDDGMPFDHDDQQLRLKYHATEEP